MYKTIQNLGIKNIFKHQPFISAPAENKRGVDNSITGIYFLSCE